MLTPGKKSSEFLVVAGLFILIVASASGLLKPEIVNTASDNLRQTAEVVPSLIQAVKDLANAHGDLLLYAGLGWAYIKRRTGLKGKELDKGGGA